MSRKQKYLVQCKTCGKLLFKTEMVVVSGIEIMCFKCKKVKFLPEDAVITLDHSKHVDKSS